MKKNILLTCIGFATPLLAFAPFATSCSQKSATEHFASVGKSATTNAGETTATFSLTLKDELKGDLIVSAKTTSGTSVNVSSPATVSGKSVKVNASINVTDLTKSVTSTFDLTFSSSSWTSSETITGFTLNYTKMEYIDVPESSYVVNPSGELTNVNIPSGSTRLNIPNTVKTINSDVLKGKFTLTSNANSITAIVIPSSLTSIKDEAISNNTAINSIDISAFSSIPSNWGSNIFKNAASTGAINVNGSFSGENANTWIMYHSGLNHKWIKDTNWKCQRYISDRTFSLMSTANYYWQGDPQQTQYTTACWGTGWIIGDATPTDTNDYTYWIGTNWHVKAGIQSCHMNGSYYDEEYQETYYYKYVPNTFKVFYGDKSTQITRDGVTGLYWDSNSEETTSKPCYTCFNNDANDGIWESEGNFRLGKQSIEDYNDAVDFNVCKINFNNVISTGASMPTSIKSKLDNINLWYKQYGCINTVADMSAAKSKAKYVGGFPVDRYSEDSVAQWENHAIAANAMTQYEAYHVDREGYLDMAHTVNDSIGMKDLDMTAQYQFNSPVIETWMDGGASGSPLITTDLEICGIYWGGQETDENDEENFIPMFSILNDTSYKDFIKDYLETK